MLAATVLVGPAAASRVACGTVITTDTVLHSNVGPCRDGGLVIGADRVTLDLNGHRVFGTDAPGDGAGILLEGRSGVEVRNGTVASFDAGIAIIAGSSGNTVTGIRAVGNVGSAATDFGDGVAIGDSSDNHVADSRIGNNGPYGGIGVYGSSSGNTIERNAIIGNDAVDVTDPNHGDPSGTQQTAGVRLEPFTSGNTVRDNVIRGSGLDGIAVFFSSTDNVVSGNDVRGNGLHDKTHRKGSGIILFNRADRNVVGDNVVIGNAANGIVLRGPITTPTWTIEGAQDNEVRNNTTRGNGVLEDSEAEFFDLRDDNFDPPCDNNIWEGNTFVTFNQACVTR